MVSLSFMSCVVLLCACLNVTQSLVQYFGSTGISWEAATFFLNFFFSPNLKKFLTNLTERTEVLSIANYG